MMGVKNGIDRTFSAFVESTKFNTGFGSVASIQTDLGSFMSSLKSDGAMWINNEHIHFYEHSTDYLSKELRNLRERNSNARIVVFIDDLDRCIPEKARSIGINQGIL